MSAWLDASFFYPPAVDAAPSWVLLDKKGRFANCDNATTAYAITNAGRNVKVTFCLAPPPTVSHVCVHHTESHRKDFDSLQAEVSSSSMGLVLLRTWENRGDVEYFVYHAAAGKPSLRAIPCPPMPSTQAPYARVTSPCVAILPFVVADDDDDGGEFLVAYLAAVNDHPDAYDLRVFSSMTWAWSTRAVALAPPAGVRSNDRPHIFDKVIALGGSVLGWVDLHCGGGIIACDVLDEDPAAHTGRFIPLPKTDFYKRPNHSPFSVHRDVACYSDGFIVLVDLDLRFRYIAVDRTDEKKPVIKKIRDFDHVNAILDSELICDEDYVHVVHVPDGWKVRTCYRHISWNYWRRGHIVDVDDITVYDPKHRTMLSGLWDGGAGRWTLRKLKAKSPILSMQGGDVMYLTVVSKKGHNGRQIDYSKKQEQKLTICVDLGKKTVEMLEPRYDGYAQPCTISQHLNTPPSQQNMWNVDGYYNGSFHGYAYAEHAGYGSYQHPPLWSPSVPHLGPSLNSLGSGRVSPANAQFFTYPLPMVNAAAPLHGQHCFLVPFLPLGPATVWAPSTPFASPSRRG